MPTQLVGDQNTLSDALGVFSPYGVAFGDSISLSDAIVAVGRVVPLATPFFDQLFITDVISIRIGPSNQLSLGDSLNFADSIKTSRTQSNPVADLLTLADAAAISLSLAMGVADALTLSDSVTATPASIFVPLTIVVSDALLLSDSTNSTNTSSFAAFGDT